MAALPECSVALVGEPHPLEAWTMLDTKVCHQILLCKKKIFITLKYRHIHRVLNVDEIKN
jgi:alpha/beta superfamily hydrolase